MADKYLKKLAIVSALFLLGAAAFGYGYGVERFGWWPQRPLAEMVKATRSVVKHGRLLPSGLYRRPPEGAPRQRVVVHDTEALNGGYYVFVGWDSDTDGYAAWLFDEKGQRLHSWPIDYASLDPDGPSGGSDAPHGFKILADGSMLVNFDKGDVMARLDACGKPLWKKHGVFHHSIEGAEDGSYWTWQGDGTAYSQYQYLVNFDPETGATRRKLGLIEDIIQPLGEAAAIFGVRADQPFLRSGGAPSDEPDDIFHPNDIDILNTELAKHFPNFAAGDLLISLRNAHLIAVIDPDNGQTKWWSAGPWRYQHDPDFTETGRISIYNNNTDRNRSEIIQIDPRTRQLYNPLAGGGLHFYSHSMGKHQYLPNGNVLIVVPGEGRVVEATEKGEKVYEFNNLISGSEQYNGHVENAVWLSADFFTQTPTCPNSRPGKEI
ncbi:arylsulfotransferase family protein [Alkalilimnicola sp. S0819]|uniref:arylsulfotransferase family protein n=1 Tax=Alkalilimnicola sp. S0819 TaxID=2613922 RepID=UPI001261B4B1|nr:arylsulfotransferase family protein [Alkalilimnicola sp. S0819]KAB7619692.1 hypothetical protein F3N43_12990 [Alkalilimnicola sp. S0819]MPQ17549.1 hypothetical protein [Alkalilimnicola sp. S0819]